MTVGPMERKGTAPSGEARFHRVPGLGTGHALGRWRGRQRVRGVGRGVVLGGARQRQREEESEGEASR